MASCLQTLLWGGIVPTAAGLIFTKHRKENIWAAAFLFGYGLLFAVSELLILTMTFLRQPFHRLVWIWVVVAVGAALWGIVRSIVGRKVQLLLFFKSAKISTIYFWIALLVIAFQIAVSVFGAHMDADDAFYVGTATTTLQEDSLYQINPYTGGEYQGIPTRYILSPFPIYLSVMSELTGIHPAVMAHRIFPIIFYVLAYTAYYLLGKTLFQKNTRAQGQFLLFCALIQMSFYYSVYTSSTFFLVRIWQGKAFLASVLLPVIFYLCLELFREATREISWWVLGFFCMAACLASSMGIMLVPVMVGIFAFFYGVLEWKWMRVGKAFLCILPCLLLGMVYILLVLKG